MAKSGPAPVKEAVLSAPLILHLRVVPNAGRDALVGKMGTAYKVKVRAPAVDGKANEALLAFLAEALDLRASQLRLVGGEKSRTKRIALSGLNSAEEEAVRRTMAGEATS